MASRDEILAYAEETYGIGPDYPWARTPNYAILRHGNNRKWFGAIVDVTETSWGCLAAAAVRENEGCLRSGSA